MEAVNNLRAKLDYVFTTGGIGPTHDDITVDSVGTAFGLPVDFHPEAVKILTARYAHTGAELNQARMRMARAPLGASLVENPVSKAPGFRVERIEDKGAGHGGLWRAAVAVSWMQGARASVPHPPKRR